jgi:hypothetical protein
MHQSRKRLGLQAVNGERESEMGVRAGSQLHSITVRTFLRNRTPPLRRTMAQDAGSAVSSRKDCHLASTTTPTLRSGRRHVQHGSHWRAASPGLALSLVRSTSSTPCSRPQKKAQHARVARRRGPDGGRVVAAAQAPIGTAGSLRACRTRTLPRRERRPAPALQRWPPILRVAQPQQDACRARAGTSRPSRALRVSMT